MPTNDEVARYCLRETYLVSKHPFVASIVDVVETRFEKGQIQWDLEIRDWVALKTYDFGTKEERVLKAIMNVLMTQ